MKTINLLPKQRQQELRYEAVFRSLLSAIWISGVSFAVVLLVQLGVRLFLQTQSGSVQGSVEQLKAQVNKEDNAEVKAKITAANNLIADYKNLAFAAPRWSKVLKAFAPLPPDGVAISSLTIDFAKKSVQINGTAPTRELVIKLYNNILNDDKEFYGIDYPLENVARPTNISFHFTFFVRDSLVKPD